MSMNHHLPEDLFSEILNKLPLKTVLRCTSVCKSWYSLITSPHFIKTWPHSSNVEKQVLIWCRGDDADDKFSREDYKSLDRFSIFQDDESFNRISVFDSPFRYTATRIVSSCNGLICICLNQHKSCNQDVFLWNPIIQRFYQVLLCKSSWGTIGFGFSSTTNDFKIVNICSAEPGRTAVFELNTHSWKNLDKCKDFLSNYYIAADSEQCFLNERIHWVAFETNGKFCRTILTFDLQNNEFGVLQAPLDIIDKWTCLIDAKLCRDSLALVQLQMNHACDLYCCVWVMNEYCVHDSWTKYITINAYNKLLGFRNNGQVFISKRPTRLKGYIELFFYNQENEIFNSDAYTDDEKFYWTVMYADYFVPSLVLLEKR